MRYAKKSASLYLYLDQWIVDQNARSDLMPAILPFDIKLTVDLLGSSPSPGLRIDRRLTPLLPT